MHLNQNPEKEGSVAVPCRGQLILVQQTELTTRQAKAAGVRLDAPNYTTCMNPVATEQDTYPVTCLQPRDLKEVATQFASAAPAVDMMDGVEFGPWSLPTWEESLCIQREANGYSSSQLPNLEWYMDGKRLSLTKLLPAHAGCTGHQLCHVFGNVAELVYSDLRGYGLAGGNYLTDVEVDNGPIDVQIRSISFEPASSHYATTPLWGLRLVRRPEQL
ncbi:MAG: hypothetical protein VX899_04180 [Myxococcota bacterium]|nr:hypothetical protein [Myxococcota bacterium]